jgi:hypothetical protein
LVIFSALKVPLEVAVPLVGIFIIGTIIYIYIANYFKKEKTKQEEWTESLKEGGIEESGPLRQLTEEEEKMLLSLFKQSNWVAQNFWLLIIVFASIDIFIAILNISVNRYLFVDFPETRAATLIFIRPFS